MGILQTVAISGMTALFLVCPACSVVSHQSPAGGRYGEQDPERRTRNLNDAGDWREQNESAVDSYDRTFETGQLLRPAIYYPARDPVATRVSIPLWA